MQIRSSDLFKKLDALGEHYRNHIQSSYLKSEFPNLTLSKRDWEEIELVTARLDLFRHQGFHLDELYLKLYSLAKLVKQARTHWGANLKSIISRRYASRPASERLMAEMAAANFPANLSTLSDMVLELFYLARKEDADQNEGKTRALSSLPEIKDLEALLATS